MLKIYTLSFKELAWTQSDSFLLSFVSEERRNRILKFKFDIDKKLSLYAALLTKMKISNWTEINVAQLSFGRNYMGKPILLSAPEIHFNFSHTHCFVLLGISNSIEIGVDVEKIRKAPLEIADKVFHPKEKEYIFNTSKEKQNLRFYRIWTQKEAFTKQSGAGLSCNLTELNMLDPLISPFFYNWQSIDYMCSIYVPTQIIMTCEAIQLNDIINYYKEYLDAFMIH